MNRECLCGTNSMTAVPAHIICLFRAKSAMECMQIIARGLRARGIAIKGRFILLTSTTSIQIAIDA